MLPPLLFFLKGGGVVTLVQYAARLLSFVLAVASSFEEGSAGARGMGRNSIPITLVRTTLHFLLFLGESVLCGSGGRGFSGMGGT